MSARTHLLFWAGAAALFIGFVFVFKAVLLPFVLGLAIAYLLNPLVTKLTRLKLGRGAASLLILGVFLIVMLAALAVLTPVLAREISDFARDLPGYLDRLAAFFKPYSEKLARLVRQEQDIDFKTLLSEHAGAGADLAGRVLTGMAAGGLAVINLLGLVVIMPVVAYFMMKEWPRIAAWTEDLMPRDQKDTIQGLLRDIDRKLSGFVRGQVSVALILAAFYAVALTIAGLKYGFLIGISAGLLSIIPMVGSALGLVVAVLVAWFQSSDWVYTAIIAGIFLFGQLVEGNFLTPKLVGDRTGLHPLWVFFALMAGGALFGLLGIFLAVPVAAVAGVLIAFGIRRYKASPLYTGKKSKDFDKKRAL